jgi:hypothetical protein
MLTEPRIGKKLIQRYRSVLSRQLARIYTQLSNPSMTLLGYKLSDPDPLDLIERDLIVAPVVEAGCPGRFMTGRGLCWTVTRSALVDLAGRLRGMPDEQQMTVDEARRYLLRWKIAVLIIVLLPVALTIYGLAHPSRHKVLLLVLGMILAPMALAIYINKTGRGGLLKSTSQGPVKNLRSLIRNHPMFIFTVPLLIVGIMWCLLLASLNVAAVEDYKPWLKQRPVTILFWLLSPVIALAYLCIEIHTPALGIYIALSVIYMAVGAALYGLQVEGGVVKFFSSYKTQASPLVILTMALFCCLAFGALHYALWTIWPSEYVNLHGVEDAIYFSVVTMATVGYGDILPVGHLARWLCVTEIVSGVILLVIGVSASMTIWLQTNQPAVETAKAGPALPETKAEDKPQAP